MYSRFLACPATPGDFSCKSLSNCWKQLRIYFPKLGLRGDQRKESEPRRLERLAESKMRQLTQLASIKRRRCCAFLPDLNKLELCVCRISGALSDLCSFSCDIENLSL